MERERRDTRSCLTRGPGSSGAERNQDCNLGTSQNVAMNWTSADGYNLKEDPRYKILCSNRRKTVTYQSFTPFKDDNDKVYQRLTQLLEYDFQRRTPLCRKSSSVEDFSKAFSDPMCMFKQS